MAQTPDIVVPNSINYTDIKPQAIENKIQLCRYQPTANVNGAKGGDLIKFLLSGNGFLDPYSTYFQFTVTVDDLGANEIRFLDRSAHSFINRLVIRSQGVEIERIENYDVSAAMINDMIYSPEQCTQHYWEGFPTHIANPVLEGSVGASFDNSAVGTNQDGAVAGVGEYKPHVRIDERDELFRWLMQGASPTTFGYVGECAFHNLPAQANTQSGGASAHGVQTPLDTVYLVDYTLYYEQTNKTKFPAPTVAGGNGIKGDMAYAGFDSGCFFYPITFGYTANGMRVPAGVMEAGNANVRPRGTRTMQFIIPIYSGVLGLLMPEKKLLPLNLLPLDIEIVFNQHALYSSHSSGRRTYRINEFNLYGNTIFFEQDIHRTLEASVADHGLFIYCNSFLSAPQQNIQGATLPTVNNIQMNLKSINSVHWVFLYTHYEASPCARKLHFVSHNLTKLQLLNGVQLSPQYPIEGNSGSSDQGQHLPFLVELYKAWNKMHDPNRDGALHAYNFCGDQYNGQFDPLMTSVPIGLHSTGNANYVAGLVTGAGDQAPTEGLMWHDIVSTKMAYVQLLNKQSLVGRCQYGISLEGEELGTERTMITGRKSQYPFQLQMWGQKTSAHVSYLMPFLRADFIIYIRPDLQIVTLGK